MFSQAEPLIVTLGHQISAEPGSADLLVSSRQRGITLVGPLLARTSPQARTGGYTADMYTLDWDRKQATCPHGTASSKWGADAPERRQGGD